MFAFNKKYFIPALLLFLIEVIIAIFIKDRFIRPYVGDFLVVMLMYCAVRSVLNISPVKIAVGVLLFAYIIETLQYFNIVKHLGWEHSTLARTVIGYGFEWFDIIAYTLGVITILIVEVPRWRKNSTAEKMRKKDPANLR